MPPKSREDKEAVINQILSLKLNDTFALQLSEPLHQTDCLARTHLITAEQHLTPVRTFHGGLMGACLDTCALMALLNSLAQNEHGVTVSSAVQLISGVQGIGKRIDFEMRLLKRTKRLAFLEGEARSEGALLAKATFTKAIVELEKKSKL